MFQLGELHREALGTAFQKEHSNLQRRFLYFLYYWLCNDSNRMWAMSEALRTSDCAATIHISIHVDV